MPGALRQAAAVARRDLAIELSYAFNLALRFSQVLFWCLSLYFVAKLVENPSELKQYNGDYFGFALVGVLVTTMIGVALGGFGRTVTDEQKAGTLELLLATPTRMATLMAGSVAVPILIAVVQVTLFLSAGWLLFGLDLRPGGLALAAVVLGLSVVVFAGLGVLSAAFVVLTKRGDPFTVVLTQMSALVAGALFPVGVLPGPVQAFARLFPAFYTLEGLRSTLLAGAGWSDTAGELGVLAGFALALIPSSLWIFSRALAAARVTGTLGNY